MIHVAFVDTDLAQLRTDRRGWPSSCNVYLVRDGARSVIVDTGLGVEPDLGELVGTAAGVLASWGQTVADVHAILLTHTHTDHAGGAVPLARITGATVHLPARGWAQAADPWWQVHHILPLEVRREVADEHAIDVAAHFRAETMPELFVEAGDVDWRLVEDGDVFQAGRYRLEAMHLPGHDVAHIAWVDRDVRLAFTGDMLVARGTALPWYPPNAGGVHGYLDSLDRLGALELRTVCPGHHAVGQGAITVAGLVRATTQAILDRDATLITALLSAPATFAALDDLVYNADVRDAIPWASSVTMAHLRHLEETGVLSRRPDGLYVAERGGASRYLRNLAMPLV
ncbi:Hydroxyacylglutathione hydrolase GloC [Burkholderiales bacterium]|nr:Hydroxyacylglutathione hydrolase GloC [Burkholderiales bacterium]